MRKAFIFYASVIGFVLTVHSWGKLISPAGDRGGGSGSRGAGSSWGSSSGGSSWGGGGGGHK